MMYVTIKEAAKIANVTEKSIRNWIKQNKITAEFSPGLRRWRIDKQSLLEFIEYK